MNPAQAQARLLSFLRLPPAMRRSVWRTIPPPAQRAILQEWLWQAHGGQVEPLAAANGGPWRTWTIDAGRGFGKTRAGAEWVWARARENGRARIALVAASLDEVARVMVEGESGLLALARSGEHPRWIASRGFLRFPSGAEAHAFTAEKPDKLRGPQHDFAWCDELAKWPSSAGSGPGKAEETWNNLMLGLRLGTSPRTIVTTTPKPVPLLRRILAMGSTAETRGATAENPHLAPDFLAAMAEQFAGTRLARQELEGELLDDFEGALWTRALIEKARTTPLPARREGLGVGAQPDESAGVETRPSTSLGTSGFFCPAQSNTLRRTVIGLDPPASTGGDSCGIVVCAMDKDGVAHVLADLSARGLSPEAWARRVAGAAAEFGAGRIVAEKNQGGDMIASILRAVDANLPVTLVAATKSKPARAEPIALRFETGRAKLAGRFPELEDQLCALTWDGYKGAGSPDRLDAMVWAMTELFERVRAEPRARQL